MTPRPRSTESENERLARLEVHLENLRRDLDEQYLTRGKAAELYVKEADLKDTVGEMASVWGWKIVRALLFGGGLGTLLTLYSRYVK